VSAAPFWTDARVREALELPSSAAAGAGSVVYEGVTTDSRSIRPGQLFVALVGQRFDAHEFLDQAVSGGAAGVVVQRVPEGVLPPELPCYLVPDTLRALGDLARLYRRSLRAAVCAITGTVGKTTTKEMARAVLATQYRVHATVGNLNNLIGTPLTLLRAPADAEVVIAEVGTNSPGEIARLAEIVEPDVAIITAVGAGHLEGLGTVAGVLEEKTSLVKGLRPGGVAIVSEEPPELPERARQLTATVRVAGWTERADPQLRAEHVQVDDEGRVRFDWAGMDVRLGARGRAQARNAMLALGLGLEWGISPPRAAAALEHLEPSGMRAQLLRIGPLRVIADCYNANPSSMEAALELLVSMRRDRGRVAVVGSMLELGEASAELHRAAAHKLAESPVDVIVATGEFVPAFDALSRSLGDRLILAADPVEAYASLGRRLQGGEVILLKGSRGVALERLLPLLERDWAGGRNGASGAGGE
jgi:UDP-N-acetylmuramoyl-tripeptide--D-alanyl-D-alanine ligase